MKTSFNEPGRQEAPLRDDHDLMCQADGCPLRWSVDRGSKLCTFHAWSDPRQWPAITFELQTRGTKRLMAERNAARTHQNASGTLNGEAVL